MNTFPHSLNGFHQIDVLIFVFLTSHTGQRDKPFVSDDEHDLRTPRPDLFERSYATDFAGESFRKV